MLHKKTTKQKKLCLPFLFNVVLIKFSTDYFFVFFFHQRGKISLIFLMNKSIKFVN